MKNVIIVVVIALIAIGFGYAISHAPTQEPVSEEAKIPAAESRIAFGSVLQVKQDIIGKWRSDTDSKFIRSFIQDGYADLYDGDITSEGGWNVFDSTTPDSGMMAPVEEGSTYLVMTDRADQTKLYFKVVSVNETKLTLIYLDRGGTLSFTKTD